MAFVDRFVTVEGRRVGYVDEGSPGARPVVLLHGGGFDHSELTWRVAVADLRDRFRLVVPDIPGYGASEGFGGPHDLSRLGHWLVAFLDALEIEQADVAGVSMGGGMGLWLALEHPERVRRLIPVGAYGLMSRLPFHPVAARAAEMGGLGLLYGAASSSRALAWMGLMANYGLRRRVSTAAVGEIMAVARDQGRRRSFDNFLEAEMTPQGLKSDLTPRLRALGVPTLFVHGTYDPVVPVRHSRRAVELVQGATLREMPTGHWPMRERPDLFNPLLAEFLAADPDA